RALEAARAINGPEDRARALAALAPHLPRPSAGAALRQARGGPRGGAYPLTQVGVVWGVGGGPAGGGPGGGGAGGVVGGGGRRRGQPACRSRRRARRCGRRGRPRGTSHTR